MKAFRRLAALLLIGGVALGPAAAESPRDGRHDFDFDFGSWKLHAERLQHPLTGSTSWTPLDGTVTVHKLFDGSGNYAEVAAEGPSGRVEILALRLYNPETRQWSLYFANPGGTGLGTPLVGDFKDGRGDFYGQDEIGGRVIQIRFSFLPGSGGEAHSEQAFSTDGGKSWEVNWINTYTRVADAGSQ